MLKIKNLFKSSYTLTGSSVLKLIMDQGMPEIDLLVRESLQNSLDAVKDECAFVKVSYLTGNFNSSKLANQLESINEELLKKYNDLSCNFLAIKDTNTKGLLGSHIYKKGEQNNLYSLVYDIMNTNKNPKSGGSWGIGKSVYYRFGNGLCFYYSQTFENGEYIAKLAGSLIENENSVNRLSSNETGIAFFGTIDKDTDQSMPIMNRDEIKSFLSIFNITPFNVGETGTLVIIPYVDYNKMLETQNNHSEPWNKKIEEAIYMAIQRWYFARLNNSKFKNKYLVATVNSEKVELNDFYTRLQKIYNFEDEKAIKVPIKQKFFNEELGYLCYRKFLKNELLPQFGPFISPYIYFDIEYEEGINKGVVFYLREPGMVLSYNSKDFNTIITGKDEYFIAMFILNDECGFEDEKLGEYFRNTEQASHTNWANITFEKFPIISSKKPYTKIINAINKEFEKIFGNNKNFLDDSSTTILQRKLGKMLLPPEDFGNGISINHTKIPSPHHFKKNLQKIRFEGFQDGFMVFKVKIKFKPQEKVKFYASISAGGKYSFTEWYNMGFDIPVQFYKFKIDQIICIKKITNSYEVLFENMDTRTLISNGIKLISYSPSIDESGNIYGIILKNSNEKEIECNYSLFIKPLDLTYSIVIDTEWFQKKEGVNK